MSAPRVRGTGAGPRKEAARQSLAHLGEEKPEEIPFSFSPVVLPVMPGRETGRCHPVVL